VRYVCLTCSRLAAVDEVVVRELPVGALRRAPGEVSGRCGVRHAGRTPVRAPEHRKHV